MTNDNNNPNGKDPPRGYAANARQSHSGSPNPAPTETPPGSTTPFGLSGETFDQYANDPKGVERIGHHVGLQWDSNPANRELLAEATAQRADNLRRKEAGLRTLAGWQAVANSTRLTRRRAVGDPRFRNDKGRYKLDAIKALILAIAVLFLLLAELAGATSLVQISGWTFIDESWSRSLLLTFPVVVAGYVQLRNFSKLLRGRQRALFRLVVFATGVVIAIAALVGLSLSVGEAHNDSGGLSPPEPIVPFAALTCLSMVVAAITLLAVEGWLHKKVDACRVYVETPDPRHVRAKAQIALLLDEVQQAETKQIDADRRLIRLTKERAAWIDWAQAQVRCRRFDRAEREKREAERRRLLAAKRRAETELDDFDS